MTRLPIVDFKTMEKVIVNLGFKNTRSKGSYFFTAMPMAEQPPSPITREGIYPDL